MAWASKKQYAIMMNSEEGKKIVDDLPNLSQEEFNKRFSELLNKVSNSQTQETEIDKETETDKETEIEIKKQSIKKRLQASYDEAIGNDDFDDAEVYYNLMEHINYDLDDDDLIEDIYENYDKWINERLKTRNDGNLDYDREDRINSIKSEVMKAQTKTGYFDNIDKFKKKEIDIEQFGFSSDGDYCIRKSPYGKSFYIVREYNDEIDWGKKPDESLRISDHWTFESRNDMHTILTDPKNILGLNGKYVDEVYIDNKRQMLVAKYDDYSKKYELLGIIDEKSYEELFDLYIDTDYGDETFTNYMLKVRE